MRGAESLKDKEEFLELFETENRELNEANERLKAALESAEQQRGEAEDSVARLDYELGQARASAAEARAEALGEQEALQAVLALKEWPETPVDIAALAVKVSGGRLVFGGDAVRSLEKSAFSKTHDARAVVWGCLRAVGHGTLRTGDTGSVGSADRRRVQKPYTVRPDVDRKQGNEAGQSPSGPAKDGI